MEFCLDRIAGIETPQLGAQGPPEHLGFLGSPPDVWKTPEKCGKLLEMWKTPEKMWKTFGL